MLLKEFLSKYDKSPIALNELAYRCTQVDDNLPLVLAGQAMLEAESQLLEKLEEIGFEFG